MDTDSKSEVNVFYANPTFYVLFRLLQVLYDRLAVAKDLSLNPQTNSNFAFLMNPGKNLRDQSGDRYKMFKNVLNVFASGNKDQNQYEEDCRTLFGIQGYVLFTLDRVVGQLTKQLQTLLAEERSSKLLALYTMNSKQPDEKVYHSHCVKLIEPERCLRFELVKNNRERGKLTIQLLDSVHDPPMYVDFGGNADQRMAKWNHYVDRFVATEDSPLDGKKHSVFLQRNSRKNQNPIPTSNIKNGLECRICISNYRLFYIENTEDCMYKQPTQTQTPKKSYSLSQKKNRLERVLLKKFGQKENINVFV
eukprot:TRINITY_DN9287_c0_g1_i1.p1 TRINITY_DN9287_c0_g1~~TRINITY_DN9287_c0_g1_i1.p1  ORF type:complete len:324 (-),score=81.61 TRINITY_DN9287_c0_g1_i1:94-1011(-)